MLIRKGTTKMTGSTTEDGLLNQVNGNFICGVVEGFYGRPWTTEQRKLLFKWMSDMGLNTYMYAPKDDYKHRAFWRELYSVEEAENLTGLIEAADENNVTFVYAISPGLDISFSNSKDVLCLKRKLEQVAAFGCKAFALLFDDIDPEMSEADKTTFQSSGHAQVSVTNEVYQHLNQPRFLFCPTEYCSTRAIPSVSNSEYLTTLGSKLLPDIDIMWTGPKVISKKLTIQSLEEVAKVLQRPPLIWDNIHANDYDPRRLFLGPYDGRSPEIIPYLRGVLTNPNCEFEANYIPLHTLAQWSKSNAEGVKKDIIAENRLSPVTADIRLETEQDFESDEDIPSRFDIRYQPHKALKCALSEWMGEFSANRHPQTVGCVKPGVALPLPTVNTCMSVTVPTTTIAQEGLPPAALPLANGINNMNQLQALSEINTYVQPTMNPVNSLVDLPEKDPSIQAEIAEPMDYVPVPPVSAPIDIIKNKQDTEMQVDGESEAESVASLDNIVSKVNLQSDDPFCYEDLELLVDLFYMPFEHGSRGLNMLMNLNWLKMNAHIMAENKGKLTPEVEEWDKRAEDFDKFVRSVDCLLKHLSSVSNKALLADMFPYVWDMLGVLRACNGYVKWLGEGQVPYLSVFHMQGCLTWMTKSYKEAFISGEQEPWMFRSGLQGEFQRMLLVDGAHDLFMLKPPDVVCCKSYTIRPYQISDEPAVYRICRLTYEDAIDRSEVFPGLPNLIGDKLVGGLVTLSPEYCFVLEDEEGVFGYGLAALDCKQFAQRCQIAWSPALCEKYPKPVKETLTAADEVISDFHQTQVPVPFSIATRYPSIARIDVLSGRLADEAVPKRLLACMISALKTNGSIGIHVGLSSGDKCMFDHYSRLGFCPLGNQEGTPEGSVFLGRII
ncbi:protein O-GlcNAcase-like [Liolophura sinensis]|uniref:protein O-GlcNAcase-like n=1 Tax=Liolophura sinensis TaxID=3198878 RepID=UPI003158EDB0